MYTTIPFGPLSIPTTPVLAILAALFGLELMARAGKKMGMNPDQLWNIGMIALVVGIVVARLWNVFQLWGVYRAEPMLILSIRPSGFAFWPGVVAALVAGYAYLLIRSMDPIRVAAVTGISLVAMTTILRISHYLTGAVVGLPSELPWALNYFGDRVHPVALYQALGLLVLLVVLMVVAGRWSATRIILLTLFGYSLVFLAFDAFVSDANLIGGLHVNQLFALIVALIASWRLAQISRKVSTNNES